MIATALAALTLAAFPAADGLVASYPLNQASGTTVTDASGNGRDATVVGGATWRGSNGLQLDGTNGYVKLPDNLMRGLSAITVSLQVKIDADQATPYFIWGIGNTTSNAGNGYLFTTGNAYRTSIATGNYTTEKNVTKGTNLTRDVWKTLTYTLTGSTGVLYEDGAEVARATNITTMPSAVGNGTTTADYIGRSVYTSDRYLKGSVRDFRVYDHALTADEVKALDPGDDARLAADAAALSVPATATTDLTLPATGTNGAAITWASDNAAISPTGKVTRGNTNTTVTLTATLKRGTGSTTKTFTVAVPALSAQEVVNSVNVWDASDVRGNLTLDPIVSWASSDPAIVGTDGVVHRGAADQHVTLTATYQDATRTFDLTVRAKPVAQPYAGYMFAYFTGEGYANGEQIYTAASRGNDALHWDELNGGNPVLTSTLGDKGVRDPFIMRSPDGDKFYLIATDLKIYGNGNWDASQRTGSKYIEVWESTDLVHWSDQRHVRVSPDTAGNTWAPEAFWSDELGSYVVFWASKLYDPADTSHSGDAYNHMMYATTRDFRTFSAPKVWKDPGYSVIDSTVIKNGSTYYRFTKDERNNTSSSPCSKFIIEEKSQELLNLNWDFVNECIGKANADTAGISQGEGPLVFKDNLTDKWHLFIDENGGRGYVPFESTDLDAGKWVMSSNYALPARPRHGTVLPVTAAELKALRNDPDPVKANADGVVASYNGSATDTSGNGYNATLNGDATAAADGTLSFGGTNGYLKLPDNIMAGLDSISVKTDVWMDASQATPYFIWGLGNSSGTSGNGYLFTTGDAYRTSIASGDYTTEQTATAGKNLPRAGWHQLTYTLSGGTAIIYLDGAEVGRKTGVTTTPGSIGGGRTTANYVGRSLYSGDKYFKGKLKDFTIYNRALSAAEVAASNPGVITGVELTSLKVPAMIDAGTNSIVLPVKKGTDVAHLAPKFTVADGTTISGERDFTNPVTIDAGGRAWTVRAVVMNTPSLPGYNADPNIVRFGDTYYIYATTDGFPGWGSTSFKVWSSRNLVDWTEHPTILDLGPDVSWADSRAWAPTITEKNGKYYFYYCADAKIGVAVADSPLGPFKDSGAPLIASNPDGGQAIDPAVFTDDDGQSYLYWGNGNAYVAPLNADMVSIDVSRRKRLTGLTDFREGSFMNKRGGIYYLTWSVDDTGSENYHVNYATGTSPFMDGLVNRGTILAKNPALGILGTGHSSIIQIPGRDEWYIAYHRFAIPGGDGTHRETTIDKLEFNADGTIKPVVPTLTGIDPVVTRTEAGGSVGGSVPATLSLTLADAPSFGTFQPGVEHDYSTSTTANVISSAGDASLSVTDPSPPTHLTNGAYALAEPLRVELSKATWTAPVTNDPVSIVFKQLIKATDPLRTGRYGKTLTFTLSTTTP